MRRGVGERSRPAEGCDLLCLFRRQSGFGYKFAQRSARVQQGVLQAAADLHQCGVEHTGRAAVFPGALLHAVKDRFFSFGVEHRQTRLLFDGGDLAGAVHPRRKQRQQLSVNRVYFLADFFKRHGCASSLYHIEFLRRRRLCPAARRAGAVFLPRLSRGEPFVYPSCPRQAGGSLSERLSGGLWGGKQSTANARQETGSAGRDDCWFRGAARRFAEAAPVWPRQRRSPLRVRHAGQCTDRACRAPRAPSHGAPQGQHSAGAGKWMRSV